MGNQDPENTERKGIQELVESSLNAFFGGYGAMVARNPWKVFIFSIIGFLALGSGMAQMKTFEDEQIIWTPAGNPSIVNMKRSQELFPSKGGFVGIMVETKDFTQSIIDTKLLSELQTFFTKMNEVKGQDSEKGEIAQFKDLCIKFGPAQQCFYGESPLTFATTPQGQLDIE